MNRFGEIADELTDLIEELERESLSDESAALKLALERAFDRACEAERGLRLKAVGESCGYPGPARRAFPAGGWTQSAVVIELPRRVGRVASRWTGRRTDQG
jgi:hypothetical protein